VLTIDFEKIEIQPTPLPTPITNPSSTSTIIPKKEEKNK
jgi:hypothetical protein